MPKPNNNRNNNNNNRPNANRNNNNRPGGIATGGDRTLQSYANNTFAQTGGSEVFGSPAPSQASGFQPVGGAAPQTQQPGPTAGSYTMPAPVGTDPTNPTPEAAPEFDWQAWNEQMMAQQSAVWESMDQINSEFLRQQQEWLAQGGNAGLRPSFGGAGGIGSDPAQIALQKRKKSKAGAKTNTTLSAATAKGVAGSALSLGGGGGNASGLSISGKG